MLKINRKKCLWLLLVFLTLPQLDPSYFQEYATQWEPLVNSWRVISALFILIWLLIKRRLSLIVLLIGIRQGYIALNTLIQRGAFRDCALSAITVMVVVILYDLMQEEQELFLSSQLFCFELIIYVNFVTILLYPGGMYASLIDGIVVRNGRNYFLGYYNSFSKYFIPALLIAFLYKEYTGKKMRTWLLTAVCYISALLTWSGGVLVALFSMAFIYVLIKDTSKWFNYYNSWILQGLFFLFIICLRLMNAFRWFIDGYLHKWDSLMLRTEVWDIELARVRRSWLFGYGKIPTVIRVAETKKSWGMHAHNQLLELLYRGGVINLILFVLIIYMAGRTIYKGRDINSKLITIAFWGWTMVAMVDPHEDPFFMAMFVIAYYANRSMPAFKKGSSPPVSVESYRLN